MNKPKIIRACTVPASIAFVRGMIPDLAKKYEVVLLSSPGNDWKEIDRERGMVKCLEVPMARQIAISRDIKALWRIYRLLRREKPMMIHSMTPKAGLLCMLAAWMARVPVRVHTFTGLVFPTASGLKKKILMATDRLTCACATHIIPEGEGVKRDLLNNHITKKDIHVLGYGNCQGIDLEYFNPERQYSVTDSDQHGKLPKLFEVEKSVEFAQHQHLLPTQLKDYFTFIVIGRLVGDKGINELITAYSRLNHEYPKTRLILLGHTESKSDPLAPETLEIIRTDPSIEAVGLQYDIRPWVSVSDVAILSSYREGFPNVVIEAGAMGLPQIVTDINGANEIIVEGKNGTIIPPRDADALYLAMKHMIDDPYWRQSMANNARDMIASRYEQSYVRRCLYDFYDQIMPTV